MQDSKTFDLVEAFAGKAEVTRMFREGKFRAAKMDLLYMNPEPGRDNPMDLTTDAGFVNLDRSYVQNLSVGIMAVSTCILAGMQFPDIKFISCHMSSFRQG